MRYDTVRRAALALPEVSEAPHHHFGSFRVRGKIFITVPPPRTHIHLFLNEIDRERALAIHPGWAEKLLWGGKVVGLRVTLLEAEAAAVKVLVRQAYRHQAARMGLV